MHYLEKVKILTKNILVRKDEKILALKRAMDDGRRPGCWDFAGGGLEKGEDIYESARREILEECGLEVVDLKVVYTASGMGIQEIDVLALTFVGKVVSEEVKLSGEHGEFAWVTPEEFLEMETGEDGGYLHKSVRVWMERI